MSTKEVKWALEEAQLKISEYSVAEAKAKAEKAEVELETAKIHQQYVIQMMERDLGPVRRKRESGNGGRQN